MSRSIGIAVVAALISLAKSSAPNDACSLLTKEDAAAALGEAATAGKQIAPMSDGAGSTVSLCEYTGSGIHRIGLTLTIPPKSSLPMYTAMCAKQSRDGLAGLGDMACWYNDQHEELHAIKGSSFLSIELRRGGSPTEAIIAVMKKALAKVK